MINNKPIVSLLFTLFTFFLFSTTSAEACSQLPLEPGERDLFYGYALFDRVPKRTYSATFVGRVKIIDIIPSFNMRAKVIESKTHPTWVEKEILLIHRVNSCSSFNYAPGDEGIILGKSLGFSPYSNFGNPQIDSDRLLKVAPFVVYEEKDGSLKVEVSNNNIFSTDIKVTDEFFERK